MVEWSDAKLRWTTFFVVQYPPTVIDILNLWTPFRNASAYASRFDVLDGLWMISGVVVGYEQRPFEKKMDGHQAFQA